MSDHRFICDRCGYVTNRLSNYNSHLNRKIPCSNIKLSQSIIPIPTTNSADRTEINSRTFNCPNCNRSFSSRQSRHVHLKKCRDETIHSQAQTIQRLESEVAALKESKVTTVNNHHVNNYITENNCIQTVNNVTNTIYNNYDEPNVDHIDAQVIKKLYFDNGRHLKKMVNEAVRKIYKKPENNTFRFPHGVKSNFVEVRYRDEKRLLPMKEVIETVLTKTSLVCEEHLRDHYYGGTIVGSAVLTHANDLEDLALQPWDDDKANRADFHPYVKSAIIECV